MSTLPAAAAGPAPAPTAPRRLILLARPGAGKSTQARRLAAALGVEHLSAGDLLRREVAASTEVGRAVGAAVAGGDLVPDDVMEAVIAPRLHEAAARGGYVLDGYPRDLRQAESLAVRAPAGSAPQVAVSLEVAPGLCRQRLLARAQAEGREDDTPVTIDRRLAAYDRDTAPVLRWYGRRGLLVRVDGVGVPSEVTGRILAATGLG